MSATLTDNFNPRAVSGRGPNCTPEQARHFLQDLRAAYQSLSPAECIAIKGMVSQSAQMQFTREMNEENECFESVC
jgi:hypothetical protein